MNTRWLIPALVAGALVFAVLLWWRGPVRLPPPVAHWADPRVAHRAPTEARASKIHPPDDLQPLPQPGSGLFAQLDRPGARPHEAVLMFKDAAARQRFLARAANLGLRGMTMLEALNAVRVRFDSFDALAADLAANEADWAATEANFILQLPSPPSAEQRQAHPQVPVGNRLLEVVGVDGNNSQWGRGVTIAIVDTGVGADATFGANRLRSLDIGLGTTGTGPDDGHATAVAALAAGAAPDAQGIAPAANLLSIRVTGADGTSDVFTVAQAILAAVDAGVQIINISLGGYQTSSVLTRAIDYAANHGVVLVAAAGNDQAAQLTWPAADPRVASVGAVDAQGQQVMFSNSGPQLQLTAPGYGLQTAWSDGSRVLFDGTSASAPVVAGAIAALMSETSGLTATQALDVLTSHASDGGPAGPDPDYGRGIVNLGWAMNRADPARVDTAISSLNYDSTTGNLEVVVQNRSARSIGTLTLTVDIAGTPTTVPISWLEPGGSQAVSVTVDPTQLATQGALPIHMRLDNPPGTRDAVPVNNVRSTTLIAPAPPGG